jgi:hypothetical protein
LTVIKGTQVLKGGRELTSQAQVLKGGREFSSEELNNACILGWQVKFLQAVFLVANDIMMRQGQGQPCWCKPPRVTQDNGIIGMRCLVVLCALTAQLTTAINHSHMVHSMHFCFFRTKQKIFCSFLLVQIYFDSPPLSWRLLIFSTEQLGSIIGAAGLPVQRSTWA